MELKLFLMVIKDSITKSYLRRHKLNYKLVMFLAKINLKSKIAFVINTKIF